MMDTRVRQNVLGYMTRTLLILLTSKFFIEKLLFPIFFKQLYSPFVQEEVNLFEMV